MESKLKNDSIKQYAERYGNKLSEQFYSENEVINGSQILSLCEVHQINLFILMELFQSWEKEIENLKSPYFNYDHPSVKEAMKKFHNSISNHIEIKKTDFDPILKAAVEITLQMIITT